MRTKPDLPPETPPDSSDMSIESERDQISQNIEAILDFYAREDQKISHSQRIMEQISFFVGQPVFLGIILFFVAHWILANVALRRSGIAEYPQGPAHDCRGGAEALEHRQKHLLLR